MDFLRKLFDGNERDVAKYRKRAEEITALEPQMKKLDDAALQAKTGEFKKRIAEIMDAECERRG